MNKKKRIEAEALRLFICGIMTFAAFMIAFVLTLSLLGVLIPIAIIGLPWYVLQTIRNRYKKEVKK